MTRYDSVKEGAAIWGSYFRVHLDKFAEMYLGLDLRLFQKIMLVMMGCCSTIVYIGSRGQGKTFLAAVMCCARCILYPGTKIVLVSGTRAQATLVADAIMTDLKPKCVMLANEIDERNTKISPQHAVIAWKNSSIIKVVTATDSARGNVLY